MDESNDTINARLEKVISVCEEYEGRLHLDKIYLSDVNYNLSKDDILKMTAIQIYGHCYECSKYLTALQKKINEQTSRYNWFDYNLNQLLENENTNYRAFSFAERKALVLKNNSAAQKLDKHKQQFKIEIDRLAYLTNRIQYQIDFASKIAYARQMEEKNAG